MEIKLNETIHTHDCLEVKIGERKGKKKKAKSEFITGDSYSVDRKKYVKIERLIDRENDKYEKIITDPDTDEILYSCKELLSKHQGHGSAKNI